MGCFVTWGETLAAHLRWPTCAAQVHQVAGRTIEAHGFSKARGSRRKIRQCHWAEWDYRWEIGTLLNILESRQLFLMRSADHVTVAALECAVNQVGKKVSYVVYVDVCCVGIILDYFMSSRSKGDGGKKTQLKHSAFNEPTSWRSTSAAD